MKKRFLVLLSSLFVLAGCNLNVGIGSLSFNKVHITTYNYSGCVDIKSWRDDEEGIEVETEDYGALFLSEGTYILVENKCPICKK